MATYVLLTSPNDWSTPLFPPPTPDPDDYQYLAVLGVFIIGVALALGALLFL